MFRIVECRIVIVPLLAGELTEFGKDYLDLADALSASKLVVDVLEPPLLRKASEPRRPTSPCICSTALQTGLWM